MALTVYINSGINEEISSALILKSKVIGKNKISVFTDFSEAVCQFGYGTALGYDHLNDGGLTIQKIENIRIGCLVVDDDGWVFTPTPLLLEAEKVVDSQPNAIKVTPDQILTLIQSTAPDLIAPNEKGTTEDGGDISEKLEGDALTKEEIDTLTTKLEKNPPQKFDISRKVNVFNSLIEFVELKLVGCSVGRQTVSIPAKLLVGNIDKNTQKQLKTGYSVLGSDSDLTGKQLNDQVEDIRQKFTRSIQHYGRVALKSKRNDLERAINEVRKNIESFQADIKERLNSEIDKQKRNLIEALSTAILENPPDELLGEIVESKPNRQQVEMYLDSELSKIFPFPDELIKEMKLECIFKGVTYETLCDEKFQSLVQKEYQLIQWDKMFREFEAIRSDD